MIINEQDPLSQQTLGVALAAFERWNENGRRVAVVAGPRTWPHQGIQGFHRAQLLAAIVGDVAAGGIVHDRMSAPLRRRPARLMLTTSGPAPVEVWRWRLEPDEEYPSHPHQAGVVETVSVTSGRMVLVVDGTEQTVEAGQTATFDGDTPHTYRGAGIETCHLIMTVHLPPGPASTT